MKPFARKYRDILIAAALALAVMLLTGAVLDCSHNWGDDFAAYFLEGIALGEGNFNGQVRLNYALHNKLDPRQDYGQDYIYAWGYPLLLSAVNRIVGFDRTDYSSVVYYKIPGLVFLGLFAAILYLLLRRRLETPASILLTVLFCTCTMMTDYTNSVLTEVVFIAMTYLTFFLSEKLTEQTDKKKRILTAVFLGIALWYTYEVRLNGIVVLLCVALNLLVSRVPFRGNRPGKKDAVYLLPFAVFVVLFVLFDFFIIGHASSKTSDFSRTSVSVFFRNAKTYYEAMYEWLHSMILHLHGGGRSFSRILVTGMVVVSFLLFAVGVVSDGFRKKNLYLTVYCLGSFIGTCLLPYSQWIRYIVMLLPVFMTSCGRSIRRERRISQKRAQRPVRKCCISAQTMCSTDRGSAPGKQMTRWNP